MNVARIECCQKSSGDLLPLDFKSDCSGAGALSCFSQTNNPPAGDVHRLPYVLESDKLLTWCNPLWTRDNPARKSNEKNLDRVDYINLQVDPFVAGAYAKAKEICDRATCSCPKVVIKCRILAGFNNLPPPFADFTVTCGTTTQQDFDTFITNWESTWWPNPHNENEPLE
ncbi:MAG: hypothetical protein PCFJNLEI_03594 [Verrucomicrobiae bacterium]|nr:hypothetical protein [Verrucomicrobiae bacterium]